ncbi:hypothetical protein KSAC_33700 (plasmid) [Komagataeibacter saccharivorans]|nr:hypothetical protein KSAC_33700 [Komagataeibacter saccharivorans]
MAHPRPEPRRNGDNKEGHGRQAGHEGEQGGQNARNRQRLRIATQLPDQHDIGRSVRSPLGHDNTGCGRNKQGGYLRYQSVTNRQGREGARGLAQRHAVSHDANRQTTNDIDDGDDDARDRIATHELGRTIHCAVESAFLFQFLALLAGRAFVYRT